MCYYLSLTVAILAALVAFYAAHVNNEKLRLDLYNRRFNIYSATLEFHHMLMDVHSQINKAEFSLVHRQFIKNVRESQFLFDDKSNIHSMLCEFHEKAMVTIGFTQHGRDLAQPGCEEVFIEFFTKRNDALRYFNDSIPKLEKAMAPYLNFHSLSSNNWLPSRKNHVK